MVHSTGHSSRLSRFEDEESAKFGSDVYSKEELIAEIGSCMLRCQYSLMNNVDNSIAYIKGWYDHIKNSSGKELVSAAQQAQKAVDYITKRQV